MIKDSIIKVFSETWPMIVLCTVIVSSLRIIYLVKNKEKMVFYRELMTLASIIYIMCLFYVVTFQDVNTSSNFIPFNEMFRYQFGSPLFFKNVIGNMIMFLPYGFFITYYLKLNKVLYVGVLSVITSLTIELIQLNIGRIFDIDDIILNILGGMAGYYVYVLVTSLKIFIPKFLQKNFVYNIITFILLIVLGFLIFNYMK